MNAPIDVALCFDDHLALPGAATILSLLETAEVEVRLHVLTDPRPKAASLLTSIAQRYGASLRIVDTAPEVAHRPDPASPYGVASTATYRRIFLADLLPELDRVLYLDADIFVRRNLSALWATALGDTPVAAVQDPWMATFPALQERYDGAYLNAGVLLIDLARWRREDLARQCIEELGREQAAAARNDSDALSYSNDQTAMNAVLRGRWRNLSPRWNFTMLHGPRVGVALGMRPEDYAAEAADPAIIHFLGAYKPWLPGCDRMTASHRVYRRLALGLERDFPVEGLRWPGAYARGPQAVARRRLIALRLVHQAKRLGLVRPAIVLTGLLGRDLLAVAVEQGLAVAGFASEMPALAGGTLDGMPIRSLAGAIADGQRDFILGDYRRIGWTRAALEEEGRRSDVELRIVAAGAGATTCA